MSALVNRGEELQTIEGALDTLLDSKRLLRTPIVEFYGVEGIGKTILLEEVLHRCRSKQLEPLWLDKDKIKNTYTDFVQATRELLEQEKKGVVIVDALDDLKDEQLREFEEGLRDLIENRFLFVVLASRSIKKFDASRSITRKLTSFHLQPLGQQDCQDYFNKFQGLRQEFRDMIYEWTHGYPLAMDVMATAIIEQKQEYPDKELDQPALLSILNKQVIRQKLLAKAKPDDLPRLETLLTLLSVPRRFNLAIMQDIVEKFVPRYKLETTLEYIALPSDINTTAAVLDWNLGRAGYCIDEPVRNLFLLKLRFEGLQIEAEESHTYWEIHRFLAELNKSLADEVSGPDHIRYLEEWFYHLSESGEPVDSIVQKITDVVERLTKNDSFDLLLQFSQEFPRDQDLNYALGGRTVDVKRLIGERLTHLREQDSETSTGRDG